MKPALRIGIILVVLCFIVGGWYAVSKQSSIAKPTISPTPTNTLPSSGQVTITEKLSSSPIPSSTSELPTKYISAVEWPPQDTVENKPFRCTEAGSETDRAGQSKKVVINSHTYCVTKVSEGAAGSIYTQYTYARAQNNQTEIYTFSLRFVQCGNYPEPEMTACETERRTFSIDNFIDLYIQSR